MKSSNPPYNQYSLEESKKKKTLMLKQHDSPSE